MDMWVGLRFVFKAECWTGLAEDGVLGHKMARIAASESLASIINDVVIQRVRERG